MENKKLNELMKKINEVNADVLGEALLYCAPRTKEFCIYIDAKINKMASISHIPYVTALEQYNEIIDSIVTKKQLINLYHLFFKWYGALDKKAQKHYKCYFITKNKRIINKSHYKERYIVPMCHSFIRYVQVMSDMSDLDWVHNPYIYGSYRHALSKYNNAKKRFCNFQKGE